ncbi:MAG: hypothetical protein QM767_16320 [Anaeromyxobacter sp.]
MRRDLPALAGLALLLAGCPIPQPLPDYGGGTTTPPRIVADGATPNDTFVRIAAGCSGAKPSVTLAASLVDPNTVETVTARWFVDYDPESSSRRVPLQQTEVPPPDSGATDPLNRTITPFAFVPYDYPPAVLPAASWDASGVIHVVELVVSNAFDASGDPPGSAAALPYRSPATGFETQVYRWTVVLVPESGDVTCP